MKSNYALQNIGKTNETVWKKWSATLGYYNRTQSVKKMNEQHTAREHRVQVFNEY